MTADTASPVVHGHVPSDVLAPVANEPEIGGAVRRHQGHNGGNWGMRIRPAEALH